MPLAGMAPPEALHCSKTIVGAMLGAASPSLPTNGPCLLSTPVVIFVSNVCMNAIAPVLQTCSAAGHADSAPRKRAEPPSLDNLKLRCMLQILADGGS